MFTLGGPEKTLLVFLSYSLFFLSFLASESSAEDSEQEDETGVQDLDNHGKEESKIDHLTHNRNDLTSKEEQNSSSLLDENKVHTDLVIAKPLSKSPESLRKDMEALSEDTDYEEEDEVPAGQRGSSWAPWVHLRVSTLRETFIMSLHELLDFFSLFQVLFLFGF